MIDINVDIAIDADGWHLVADLEGLVGRAVTAALTEAGVDIAVGTEVSVLLAGDDAVQVLNARWRGLDKPTNVLSFPAGPPGKGGFGPFLGDLALAFETTQREAENDGKPLASHLAHLVVHGVLHLVGHDHETEAEAERMEATEIRALERLGISDPYAGTEPDAS